MNSQTTKEISIDVSNHKYISINAKQYDRNLRYILITCYNQGVFFPIKKNIYSAYIRYKKPDNYEVFNICEITGDGKILVELTEQMLAVAGLCYADVVIHKNMALEVDIAKNNDGSVEIINIGNDGIISTMTFVVNVYEAAFDNEQIESSYEYNALNDLLTEAVRDYTEVLNESYKYMNATEGFMNTTEGYKNTTEGYKNTTEGFMDTTEGYKNTTISYTVGGTGTRDGEDTDNAKWYYSEALKSADNADESEAKALEYRNLAQSYAIGGTGVEGREDESVDNAKYYYEESSKNAKVASNSKDVVEQINDNIIGSINTLASNGNVGSFIFMGEITFEELTLLPDDRKAIGYVYNIIDDFATDDTFAENNIGLSYTAGTNVYYTPDEKWLCLGGAALVVAAVDEVMIALGIQNEEIEEVEEIV